MTKSLHFLERGKRAVIETRIRCFVSVHGHKKWDMYYDEDRDAKFSLGNGLSLF